MKTLLAYRDLLYLVCILLLLFFANTGKEQKQKPKYILKESRQKVDSISRVVLDLKNRITQDSVKTAKYLTEIVKEKQQRKVLDEKMLLMYEKLRENNNLPLVSDSTLYNFFSGFDTQN